MISCTLSILFGLGVLRLGRDDIYMDGGASIVGFEWKAGDARRCTAPVLNNGL